MMVTAWLIDWKKLIEMRGETVMITLLHICEIDICELAQAIVKKKRRELSPLNYLNNVTVLSIADRSQSRAMIFTENKGVGIQRN